MNLVNSIEEFKEKYDGNWDWFIVNECTMEVLEYFVSNYDISYDTLDCISLFQTLTEDFIEKNKIGIIIKSLLSNTSLNLSYAFLEKHLYQYNLYEVYEVYHNIEEEYVVDGLGFKQEYIKLGNVSYAKDKGYSIIFERLREKYPHKYEIDKLSYEINKNN